MATPINSLQDILDGMEQNAGLREALRRHILTDELLQMPPRLTRIEEDIGILKEDARSLKQSQAELPAELATMGGTLNMLVGEDYESHVAKLASRYIMRDRGVRIEVLATQRDSTGLADPLFEAEAKGMTKLDDTRGLETADLILTVTGTQDHILAEISVTIQQKGIDRAKGKAAMLAMGHRRQRHNRSPSAPGSNQACSEKTCRY